MHKRSAAELRQPAGVLQRLLKIMLIRFIPYMLGQLHTASRLDLVWDSYIIDSLKSTARAKRGKGIRRRVVASAPIPGNWQSFLRTDLNKKALFSFALVESFTHDSKELIVTDGSKFSRSNSQFNVRE